MRSQSLNDREAECNGKGDVDMVWGSNCVVRRQALVHKMQTQHQALSWPMKPNINSPNGQLLFVKVAQSVPLYNREGEATTWVHGDGF